ncbi:MAG: helix-turn-helix domain-containing protein [[Clostridium] innocuum]
MDYISVKEAAEKWAISERRIQKLCEDGRIDGVERFGRSWMIPRNSKNQMIYEGVAPNKKGGDIHV